MLHHVLEEKVYFLNPYDKILSIENEMYKQLYEESKQRRNQVNAKYAPTITIITAETGAILWIVFKIITDIEECNLIIQLKHLFPVLLATVTAFVWLMAIFFFIICLTNNIDDNVIYLMNESLKVSYIDAAIKNNNKTRKDIAFLRKCVNGLSLMLF